MPHMHPCDNCDEWFRCDEMEIKSEFTEGCTVEPARCPSCEQRANEAAYGGSGPVTVNEFCARAAADKARGR